MADDPVKDEDKEVTDQGTPSAEPVRMRMRFNVEIDYELPPATDDPEAVIGAGLAAKIVKLFENGLDIDGVKSSNIGVSVEKFVRLK